jgi:hypothetical protein
MRDFHEVQVVRGVTHILAPRDPTKLLQLSEAELPLDHGVGEMLAAHVDGGLHDAQAKAASFVVRSDDRTYGACARLLGTRPHLIDISHELARRLYAVVERDDRISDGTLAVLICQARTAEGAIGRFPAILKLDPSAKLRTITDTEPISHKRRVRYEVDSTTLPSTAERIQKCAFIRTVDQNIEYEMLVVDRQRRSDVVSKFWVGEFLGAEFTLDGPERTKLLYRALIRGRNELEDQLDATQLAALSQVIEGAVVQTHVNVDDLLDSLPVPEPARAHIAAAIARDLPDREFDLDPDVAAQFVRRRTYRGDNGLRVSVPADFAEMINVEDIETDDRNVTLRKIWFETRTWKES